MPQPGDLLSEESRWPGGGRDTLLNKRRGGDGNASTLFSK
jgi:hypothetical protein